MQLRHPEGHPAARKLLAALAQHAPARFAWGQAATLAGLRPSAGHSNAILIGRLTHQTHRCRTEDRCRAHPEAAFSKCTGHGFVGIAVHFGLSLSSAMLSLEPEPQAVAL
jgi:hypothetical protein